MLPAWCCGAGDADFAALMAKPAEHRITAADFIQTRKLSGMDMELRIRGKMVFERDGRLRWQTDSPLRGVTVIDGGKLTHFDHETGKKAVIDQKDAPWLGLLRSCMNDWLCGDPRRLAGRFHVSAPEKNTLLLIPKDRTLEAFYRSILLRFTAAREDLDGIVIEERGGDRLEIRFTNVRHPASVPDSFWRVTDE